MLSSHQDQEPHDAIQSFASNEPRQAFRSSSCALLVALLALHAAPLVDARSTYYAKVPNSARVTGFKAIGHIADTNGGGPRNAFGVAFEAANLQWTPELCALDSDGDGQTNGQELGDPCCKWSSTSKVTLWNTGVSHPGDKSKTSDPSLWASANCSSSLASASTSNTTTAGDSVPTPASTSGATSVQCAVGMALAVGAMLTVALC